MTLVIDPTCLSLLWNSFVPTRHQNLFQIPSLSLAHSGSGLRVTESWNNICSGQIWFDEMYNYISLTFPFAHVSSVHIHMKYVARLCGEKKLVPYSEIELWLALESERNTFILPLIIIIIPLSTFPCWTRTAGRAFCREGKKKLSRCSV